MSKTVKWILISLLALAIILFVGYKMRSAKPDKASPPDTALYEKDGTRFEVNYSRPGKKGREIFGKLVPYGKVWRTGANEATVFTTNKDITIDGQPLKAGKYTLWTIPEKDHWSVIFNTKMYPWGVDFEEKALREPAFDALIVNVPIKDSSTEIEDFTIKFEEQPGVQLTLAWDKTLIILPIQ